MSAIDLSIIIPAYNEEDNFNQGSLVEMNDYLCRQSFGWEVVLVDDGSTDQTARLLSGFCRRYPHFSYYKQNHRGKAQALAAGLARAKGKRVLFTDFDQATPIKEIEKLWPLLGRHYDIVIGSREIKGASREQEPFYRHLMGKAFNLVVRLVAVGGIADTQCGFKLMTAKAAKYLFNKMNVYGQNNNRPIRHPFTGAADVELLFLARKFGYKIAEVPVHWRHYRTTRVNPWRDSVKMFIDLWRIRLADRRGVYDGNE